MKNTPLISENANINLRETWTNLDDFLLLKGIFSHGYDNWKIILDDKTLWNDSQNQAIDTYKLIFYKIEKVDLTNTQMEDENVLK